MMSSDQPDLPSARYELFFSPGSCSRVTTIALEELGVDYRRQLVSFMAREHRRAEFLRVNPTGRVPVLLVDGAPLFENVAILTYLDRAHPDGKLLPHFEDPLQSARVLADLLWCASGLHPIVTRLRVPQFVCDLPEAKGRVWEMAAAAMLDHLGIIERRLREQPWMLGEAWSILDAYVNWIWYRVTGAGLDVAAFQKLSDHAARIGERPSVRRALSIEAEAEAELAARGLALRFDTVTK